jgi:capsular exopolysaccharide synthesis family protein
VQRPAILSAAPDAPGLLRAFRRRWRLATFGGLLGALVTVAFVHVVWPQPKCTARVLLFVSARRPKEIFDTRESVAEYKTYQQTQTTLITSRKVLRAALQRPGVAALALVKKQEDPIVWLGEKLKVDFPNGSEILTISLSSEYPKDSVKLVNAVADSYLNRIVEEEQNDRRARLKRLQELFNTYQKNLRDKRSVSRKLVEAGGSNDKQGLALRQQLASQQLSQLKQEVLQLQSELRRSEVTERVLASRVAQLTAPKPTRAEVDAAVDADAVVVDQAERLASLMNRRNAVLRSVRNPSDPSVLYLDREIAGVRATLEKRRAALRPVVAERLGRRERTGLENEHDQVRWQVEMLKEQERTLLAQVATLEQEIKSFSIKSMDVHWLEDEITLAAEAAKTVGAEVQAMNVELQAPPRIRLIEKAETPAMTDPTRRVKVCGLAAFAALTGFAGLVSLWEFYSRRIDSRDVVVQGLGMRLMGSLPALPPVRKQHAGEAWQRLVIESIDEVRTMLLHLARVESIRVLMVTSATKGEGKTSLSCHLATSLARASRATLLIDGDLRNPSVHQLLGEPRGPGLCELLRREAVLGDVIRPVRAGLAVIPAGRCDDASIEALGSGGLSGHLERLRKGYDFVIIDAPPALLVTDTLVIGQQVDAALFSILGEVSRVPQVHAAHERLTALGVRILGAVVAGIPTPYRGRDYPYVARPCYGDPKAGDSTKEVG